MFRQGGKTTSIVADGRKKVHTTWEDGAELVEEYDVKTDELLVRKRRAKTVLGRIADWEYLVGEPPRTFNPYSATLVASSSNPVLSRADTPREFCWRIRNLPYPADVYSVTAEGIEVVVRTSNKKYFKRIKVPELEVARLQLNPAALSWKHQNNTLIVTYLKPPEVLRAEQEDRSERQRMPARKLGDPFDTSGAGDVPDCKQQ